MKFRDHRVLADQNIRLEVVEWLRRQGCDVARCADMGLAREIDRGVLRWAHSQNRVLLTHDTDFGELSVRSEEPDHGIVLVRPGHGDPGVMIRQIEAALDHDVPEAGPWLMTIDLREGEPRVRLRT